MPSSRLEKIQQIIVTAEQMRAIETRVFDAGMPVEALMEKVAGLVARRIQQLCEREREREREGEGGRGRGREGEGDILPSPFSLLPSPFSPSPSKIGVLVGPGHNGGDALVVARELHFKGYEVIVYCPFSKLKELTDRHARYAMSLGIPCYQDIAKLSECDLFIDGLFGFGLDRSLVDPVKSAIDELNQWSKPVFSIDLPSGLHTDTGEVLGTAVRATHTFCLGLWKLGLLQDSALDYIGTAELIDFDLPLADIREVLDNAPKIERITAASAIAHLPLPLPPTTHKYKNGHLLLICGSRKYSGAAILSGLGARASGVGMLSIAVPESMKPLLSYQLPDALIIGCPETENGAIANLPLEIDLTIYHAIATGPGLTLEAAPVIEMVLDSDRPVVLDADGLNILAHLGTIPTLSERSAPTILTPHAGEFKRLFPDLDLTNNRINANVNAAQQSGAVVLLKGARTAIAFPDGSVSINPESTPALARGGSGDVLTGLMGGLIASAAVAKKPIEPLVKTAAWWHARSGILAAQERTELGVDALTLTQYLIAALRKAISQA